MENNNVSLSVGDIVSNGLSNGLKYFVPLLLTGILYVITIWIPYLNLGTTIGVWDIIAKIGRGESVNPTDIFDPKYRQRIGDFFLLLAFLAAGTFAGLVVPGAGYVIQIAWMLALPLFVDKGLEPQESITVSNRLTHGNKLTIFFGLLVLGIVIGVGVLILMFVGGAIADILGILLAFIGYLFAVPILLGATAYIYQKLAGDYTHGGAVAA